jgi:hypothetical protein
MCMPTRDISPCAWSLSHTRTHFIHNHQNKHLRTACLRTKTHNRNPPTRLRSTSCLSLKLLPFHLLVLRGPARIPDFMRRCQRYCVTFFHSHVKIHASARNRRPIQKLFLSLQCAFHENTVSAPSPPPTDARIEFNTHLKRDAVEGACLLYNFVVYEYNYVVH